MLKRYLIVSICLLLGGCSWWPWGSDEPAAPPAPKTIGVISVLSSRIAVIDTANSGWSRRTAFYPLAGWPIDDLATSQATAWLQQKGFDVRPVSAQTSASSAQALGGPVSRGGWFDQQRPSFTDIIHHSVQPGDLDYYLILVEGSGSSNVPDLHGIGFVHFSHRPQAFIAYHVFLIDGKSGETLDDVHADADNQWGSADPALDAPYTDLPKAVWPQQITAWSPEQQAAFRDGIDAELASSLKSTLHRLDLP